MQDTAKPGDEAGEPKTRRRPSDTGTTISDSFKWDLHDSIGAMVLGALVLALMWKVFEMYERLLRAYAAGYVPSNT